MLKLVFCAVFLIRDFLQIPCARACGGLRIIGQEEAGRGYSFSLGGDSFPVASVRKGFRVPPPVNAASASARCGSLAAYFNIYSVERIVATGVNSMFFLKLVFFLNF